MKTYKYKNKNIKLTGLTRLYPACVVELYGERSEMSLEWIELNADKVNIINYVLVFDYTPIGDEEKIREVLEFKTKDELLDEIQKVAVVFNKG